MKDRIEKYSTPKRVVKTWGKNYIEFLIKLSKPIKDNLPMGWSVLMIG
ncbi:hypothetical protein ABE366_15435 [Acinetobacter pittii]|nr:hypothetical protein [Acinetobacter pittii]MCU4710392.1 hypothetical protein [Acinetobacter pittii]